MRRLMEISAGLLTIFSLPGPLNHRGVGQESHVRVTTALGLGRPDKFSYDLLPKREMRHFSPTSSFVHQRPRIVEKLHTVPSDHAPCQPSVLHGCCGFSRAALWEKAHCGTQHGLLRIATLRQEADNSLFIRHLRPSAGSMRNASRTAAFVHLFLPEAAVNWKAKSSIRGKTAFSFLLLTPFSPPQGCGPRLIPLRFQRIQIAQPATKIKLRARTYTPPSQPAVRAVTKSASIRM